MSINGKRDNFNVTDLRATARVAGLRQGRASAILGEVSDAVAGWRAIAKEAGVDKQMSEQIARSHRLTLPAD